MGLLLAVVAAMSWGAPQGVDGSTLGESGWASGAVAPDAYVDAVGLMERLFLEPQRLEPVAMLHGSGRSVAEHLHWLQVGYEPRGVLLSHGSGAPIGYVEVSGLRQLPLALTRLEALVEGSGYDLGGTDVRLAVLSGLTDALDQHSRILADDRLDRFEVRLSGTQVGIGATFERSGDAVVLTELSDGGPAMNGGLHVGDHLVRIDGRSTLAMPLSEITSRVQGVAGTTVILAVAREGQEQLIVLPRAEVALANVTWRVLPGDVGYLYIEHVSQRTVENLDHALSELARVGALAHGLVIDLRGNTGGSMKESASVADLFVEKGLLLRTVGKDGGQVQNLQSEMYARDDGTEPDAPIVLVVDDHTASGSEILTGALIELGRAAVIGARTYGKGTVQKVYPLGPEVRLKLTVARYILANGRVIAERTAPGVGGIAPDVWVGEVEVDREVRFVGWDEPRTRAEWDRVVPEVVSPGDRGDLAVEIARRAVLGARSAARTDVLEALQGSAAEARREQSQRLAAALTARGVDWTPAPAPGGAIAADVQVSSARASGSEWAVTATVTNRGTVPLYRSLVQLSCPSAPYWDGVVVPIGAVPARGQVGRALKVQLPPGVEPREDLVTVRLVADGREVRSVGEGVLQSASSRPPDLKVQARLVPLGRVGPHGDPVVRADIGLTNLSRLPLESLQTYFAFPEDESIELLEHDTRVPVLPPLQERWVQLSMELGPGGPTALPLELVVENERYGVVADWPLLLPVSGASVTLEAPAIEARPAVRASPVGRFVLPITVTDDRKVDHVVVWVNGEKVAWGAGGGPRVDLAARFELLPGDNEVEIVAEDDLGIVSSRRLGIRGQPNPEAVDAGL